MPAGKAFANVCKTLYNKISLSDWQAFFLEVRRMQYTYQTKGTCSRQILIDLDGDVIRSVRFVGGCNGNTKGISALVAGMKAEDVIHRCEGITCGFKPTSCPDQLSHALREALAANR